MLFRSKLKTDATIYALQLDNDYQLQTFDPSVSGLQNLNYNGGFVTDLGIAVKLQRLQLALSINNLGYGIHWKHGGKTYTSKGTNDFSGFDSYDISTTTFEDVTDRVKESLNFKTENKGEYVQSLPVQTYLSAVYDVNPMIEMGGLFYAEQSEIETKFGITINATAKLIKGFNLGLSYGLRNANQKTVGLHATLRLFNKVQLYYVTDNILSITNPYDSKSINGRFGINLLFVANKEKMPDRKSVV